MSASAGPYAIGIDIGGTFTDVVGVDPAGVMRLLKIPTTPRNPSAAAIEAVGLMQSRWGVVPEAIARFVHGTTIATNAVLERRLKLRTTLRRAVMLQGLSEQLRRGVEPVKGRRTPAAEPPR